MTAIDFLESYKRLNSQINFKLDQIEQLKASATNTTSSISSSPCSTSLGKSRMEEVIIKYADLEEQINSEIDDFYAQKIKILDVVSKISDDRQRLVIQMRYLDGCSWTEIGDSLFLSRTSTFRLLQAALTEVQKILDNMGY